MIGAFLMLASFIINPLELAGRDSSVRDAVGGDGHNRRELVCERLGRLAAVSGLREEGE